MAFKTINVYNVYILKRHYLGLFGILFAALFLMQTTAYAQSALQPSNTGLQQQTGQTQNTSDQLNQTGSVQTNSNNGGEAFLNQSTLRPLGVVSDPTKTTPEAIVAPSPDLKTEAPPEDGPNLLVRSVMFLIVASVVGGFIYLWRAERKPETAIIQEEEATFQPETVVKKPKKDKRSRKKRKKSNQR